MYSSIGRHVYSPAPAKAGMVDNIVFIAHTLSNDKGNAQVRRSTT